MPDAVDSRCDAGEKVRVAQVGRGLWGTYTEAQAAADRGGFSGVGVMLSGGLVGIDMDGVVGEGGKIEPWAQKVVDEIGSYAEISPSGTGVHVIARADPSVVGAIGRANHAKGLEVYNHSRFFTVTGRQIAGKGIADATGGVAKLLADEFPSESGEDRLRRAVGRMARDQVGRRANRAVAHNAERDGARYRACRRAARRASSARCSRRAASCTRPRRLPASSSTTTSGAAARWCPSRKTGSTSRATTPTSGIPAGRIWKAHLSRTRSPTRMGYGAVTWRPRKSTMIMA